MVALLIAASMGMLVTLVGTPVLIRAFQARGIGQQIRDDGPQGHATKAGTPTMGGLMVVLAAIVGYTSAHVPRLFTNKGATFTAAGFFVLMAIVDHGHVDAAPRQRARHRPSAHAEPDHEGTPGQSIAPVVRKSA